MIDQAIANCERNIQNAEELFQSKLDGVFMNPGEDWEKKELGDISEIMYGYTAKSQSKGSIKYLRITDLQKGSVNWNKVPFCVIDDDELSKYNLKVGDVVFARTGATTGKSHLIKKAPKSVFASYLIRVDCDRNKLLPGFLFSYFKSGHYWEIIRNGKSGAAQGGFNATKLKKLTLHYPMNKALQSKLIDKFEEVQNETNRYINANRFKILSLQELRQSLLEQAFQGELTAAWRAARKEVVEV